jgi:hypothetical protein
MRHLFRIPLLALGLALAARSGWAANNLPVPGVTTHRITVMDPDLIRPTVLTMRQTDVLEFENHSGYWLQFVVVEPAATDGIRCRPSVPEGRGPDDARWLSLDLDASRRITATIPPGRYASACSLGPGEYGFVVTPLTRDPRGAHTTFETTGTITVQ